MPCGTRHWLAVSTAKAMRPSTKVVSPFTRGRIASAVMSRPSMIGVAGEHAQRRRVAGHLDVGVLEDVLVAVEALGLLVEAGERVHLRLDLLLDLPGEVVARGLVRALRLRQTSSTVPLT